MKHEQIIRYLIEGAILLVGAVIACFAVWAAIWIWWIFFGG
jgi:hypothetical protein